MTGAGPALPIVSLSEAQAYLRIETGEDEALLAGLIRSASGLCEAFLNQVVIARGFELTVAACGQWERLAITPVRSITDVSSLDSNGVATALPATSYQIDIDSTGDGWVRFSQSQYVNGVGASRLHVTGTAGMAEGENDVPEPLRQGVLRLVAHLFTERDGSGGQPPAAGTALWRPYRRLRLS